MTVRTRSFRLGAFTATVLDDGPITVPASFMFANADPAELRVALAEADIDAGRVEAGLAGLLLETLDGERILLDPGTGGRWHEGLGHLPAALKVAGSDASEIDTVIVSHGHPDHLGGLLDDDGEVRYRNARHVMARAEWDFWTSEASLATVDPTWATLAREVLPRLEGRTERTEGEVEVSPGVRTLPCPGHTAGHMGVRVDSGGETLLWFGDAFGHPLGLSRPDWTVATDADPPAAERSRRTLARLAAESGALVFANHFAFPGLGRVERVGGGYAWRARRGGSLPR